MRPFIAALVLLLTVAVSRAEALTIRDVIELTRAGLPDEVLLALIDVDRGVYATDPETLKALKAAGVSERVMVALVRSGRERPVVPDPPPAVLEEPPPPPQVIVIEHHEPRVEQVVVPVPVYVPVESGVRRHRRADVVPATQNTFVPFHSGAPAVTPEPRRERAPVYWGFGGKLRPDAWGQPVRDREKPSDRDGKSDKDGKSGKDGKPGSN